MREMNSQNFEARADRIIMGEYSGEIDSLIQNPDYRFAQAFLLLIRLMGQPVYPFDEACLRDVEHQLDYLQAAERVRVQRESLAPGWQHHNIGAFMGFLGEEEEPVLLTFRRGSYRMLRAPHYEPEKLTTKALAQLSSRALFLIPSVDDKVQKGWRLLLKGTLRQKEDIPALLGALIVASLLTAVLPLMVGYITSSLIPSGDLRSIAQISFGLVLGLTAALCLHVFVNRTKLRIQTNSSDLFFKGLFGRIMDLSPGDETEIAGKLVSLMPPLLNASGTIIGSGASALIFLIQCLLVLSMSAGGQAELRLVFYLLVFIEFVLFVLIELAIYRRMGAQLSSQETLASLREEMINNVGTIKSYGMEDRAYYRFAVAYDAHLRQKLGIANLSQWVSIIGKLASGVGVLSLFFVAAKLINSDAGQISSVVTSFSLAVGYIMSFSLSADEVVSSLPYLRVADAILAIPAEEMGAGGGRLELKGRIDLRNVSFAYSENAHAVIRDVNLTIEPGEYVGIAGSSGSGKSTLIRLMLGFLKPSFGSICYDDWEIEHYDIRQLRRQFGVVLQDSSVISGNIRMNIGMSEDADMEKVVEAAKRAAIYEDIEAMPMKFNTILSSEAEVISGGQKQRIALARALMNNPKILFLDEATSAMDNVTQQVVKENLDALGVTRIMVAHRLSTLQDCDRILFMDKGRIVEEGSFEELMDRDGLFAKMARRNLL